jgi:glycosyltransferase involved in cell wall biosynthesis
MRVLFVSPYVPSHIRIRPFAWIRTLTGLGCRVHLVALRPPEDGALSDSAVRASCEACEVFPLPATRTAINGLLACASSVPLQAAYSRSPLAERRIRELAATGEFDVVHIEHLRGSLLPPHPCPAPTVYDAVDCITRLFEQAARLAPGIKQRAIARLDLGRTRRFEARAPYRFNRVAVSSEGEARAFVDLAGPNARPRVRAIPNGVNADAYSATRGDDGTTVLFAGKMSYHANEAAALRLARRIMPLVWARVPGARLVIAGKGPTPALGQLSDAQPGRIEVTGYLEDLRPLLSRAAVLAAPLVYGAGIQNKVLEAMAAGTPVVTAPTACAALQASVGRDLLSAGNDEEFADTIVHLLRDPDRRAAIGRAGRRYVVEHHQWPALGRRLIDLYEEAREDFERGKRTPVGRP